MWVGEPLVHGNSQDVQQQWLLGPMSRKDRSKSFRQAQEIATRKPRAEESDIHSSSHKDKPIWARKDQIPARATHGGTQDLSTNFTRDAGCRSTLNLAGELWLPSSGKYNLSLLSKERDIRLLPHGVECYQNRKKKNP